MPLPSPMDDRGKTPCASGLYVVATPIGNLGDITLRAIEILGGVDLIAAEDTRHTARLLTHYGIQTPLVSCHEHNERQRSPDLIEKIRSGLSIALVSDAGTPSVSDPGYRLIRSAAKQGLPVYPIPGVSAAVTALSASGLPMDSFVFLGFAPKKQGKRQDLLESLVNESRTMVFYESPRRVTNLLKEIQNVMGDREAVLAREMTKLHEEFVRGSLSNIRSILADRQQIKGECTLLIGGDGGGTSVSEADLVHAIRFELAQQGARVSILSKRLARKYRLPKKTVYEMALQIDRDPAKEPEC